MAMDEQAEEARHQEKIDPEAIAHLSNAELEDLASRLATARLKQQETIGDPFEEWEHARKEILTRMKIIRQQHKVHSSKE